MHKQPMNLPGGESPQVYEIARDILAQMPTCTTRCHQAMQTLSQEQATLRARVQGRIAQIQDAPTVPLGAVDGTHEVLETAGVTMMLLVAVAVHETTLVDQRTRVLTLPPLDDVDLLAGDLRTRLELGLLADLLRALPDTHVILDGSLISVYLTLRRLLRRHSADQRTDRPDWWSSVPDLLDRQRLAADWRTVLAHDRALAHPKRVTTRHDLRDLPGASPLLLGSDGVFWSSILQEGEYTHPAPLMAFPARVPETFWGLAQHDRNAITAAHGRWRTTYVRLRPYGPALRLELPDQSTPALMTTFSTIRSALRVSEMLEPLPQYLADALCTAQRRVLNALVHGVHTGLRQTWAHELVSLWMGEFRSR